MPANWSGTPKTWSTGELVTASNLNGELRDRMEFLKLRILEGQYIHIRDEKAANTNGGTFTSGAWQTRDLNTEASDAGGYASIASNQITLAAGTYLAEIKCPAMAVGRHQARLQDVTGAVTLLTGTPEYSASTDVVQTSSYVRGVFTLAASKVLEVQHKGQVTAASSGFGQAGNFGTEVYTVVELIRIGD